MALKATIFRAELDVADIDRNYFRHHSLTLARHPSETNERMMVRLLAFALHAHEHLSFGAGLSTDDEPDLWLKDLTGTIDVWIDVGQPDEKSVRKACGRARRVFVYSYGARGVELWWEGVRAKLTRSINLEVYALPPATSAALAALADRSMQLQCTIQEGAIWLASPDKTVHVEMSPLLRQPEATGA
jgi:uncharacterized protein YaeQ